MDWFSVGLSLIGGGLLNGLLKGAFRFKTVGSHTWNATSKWMNNRGIQLLKPGQHRHHWLLERNQGLGKHFPEAIGSRRRSWGRIPQRSEVAAAMNGKISKAWTPGDFPLRESDWLLTQSDLEIAEQVLRDVSTGTNWQVVGNIRTDWPARRLRRRRGLKVEEIRVLLSQQFDQPDDRTYFVDRVSVVGFRLWRREGDYVKGRSLDATEISNAQLVRDSILRFIT